MDFPFHEVYRLDDYKNHSIPSIFFGMYRFEDRFLWSSHFDEKIIFWTGQDVLQWKEDVVYSGTNVTAHPKVYNFIKSQDEECKLVKPAAYLNFQRPQILGRRIYAYCPNSAPDYHGKKIIDELRCGGYEIVIGDGQFSQAEWRMTQADFHYKDIFIGLCLSEFAGGGGSIIEMGLRGINVVTNVFNLPNCIPWNSINDVIQAIEDQTQYIGHSNPGLANRVWNDLDHKHEWLNT